MPALPLGQLAQLQRLFLGENQLTQLPVELGRLAQAAAQLVGPLRPLVLGLVHILRRTDAARLVRRRRTRASDIQQVDRRAQPAGEPGGWGEQRSRGRRAVERQQQTPQHSPRPDGEWRRFRANEQDRLPCAGDHLLGHAPQAAARLDGVAVRRQHDQYDQRIGAGPQNAGGRIASLHPHLHVVQRSHQRVPRTGERLPEPHRRLDHLGPELDATQRFKPLFKGTAEVADQPAIGDDMQRLAIGPQLRRDRERDRQRCRGGG